MLSVQFCTNLLFWNNKHSDEMEASTHRKEQFY